MIVTLLNNLKVDTDKLLDWKEKLSVKGLEEEKLVMTPTKLVRSPIKVERSPIKREPNNNELERGTLVNVNNTDIALFKYGKTIIGGFEKLTSSQSSEMR